MNPEPINRECPEVIRDPRSSFEHRQAALEAMYLQAGKYGRNWQVGQWKELNELSALVFDQATNLRLR